jgi:RIO kinase 1
MLQLGLIHGDLSEFNVLIGQDGPVIIDLPQAVNAAGNNAASSMLERDVNNIRATLGRFAPDLLETELARQMWALYQQGELHADSDLASVVLPEAAPVDSRDIMRVIDDAREEAMARSLGREDQAA